MSLLAHPPGDKPTPPKGPQQWGLLVLARLWHAPRDALLLLVRAYRLLLSPSLGLRCRFTPTCSAYAQDALGQHGASLGSVLTLARLARCHPWCAGGHDPVPPVLSARLFGRLFTSPVTKKSP